MSPFFDKIAENRLFWAWKYRFGLLNGWFSNLFYFYSDSFSAPAASRLGSAEALLLYLWAQYMCLWTICVCLHICGPSIFAHGNTLVDLAPKWQEHHSAGVSPSPSPTYLHYIVFSYLSKKNLSNSHLRVLSSIG